MLNRLQKNRTAARLEFGGVEASGEAVALRQAQRVAQVHYGGRGAGGAWRAAGAVPAAWQPRSLTSLSRHLPTWPHESAVDARHIQNRLHRQERSVSEAALQSASARRRTHAASRAQPRCCC